MAPSLRAAPLPLPPAGVDLAESWRKAAAAREIHGSREERRRIPLPRAGVAAPGGSGRRPPLRLPGGPEPCPLGVAGGARDPVGAGAADRAGARRLLLHRRLRRAR